ncbi:hypothetical protein BDB01DRAFT_840240 [Pilobolus umbonatus]|nr:hypothetical protein BDB01DRAFT_840240 [Pilobolus umbonatus]
MWKFTLNNDNTKPILPIDIDSRLHELVKKGKRKLNPELDPAENENHLNVLELSRSIRSERQKMAQRMLDRNATRRMNYERLLNMIDQFAKLTINDLDLNATPFVKLPIVNAVDIPDTSITEQDSTTSDAIISEFERLIKQGPTEICCCCGGTWFPEQMKTRIYQASVIQVFLKSVV